MSSCCSCAGSSWPAKIAFLVALPHLEEHAGWVLAALVVVSSLISHAPSRVRYHLVLGGRQVPGGRNQGVGRRHEPRVVKILKRHHFSSQKQCPGTIWALNSPLLDGMSSRSSQRMRPATHFKGRKRRRHKLMATLGLRGLTTVIAKHPAESLAALN